MDDALRRLTADLLDSIATSMDGLYGGQLSVDDWQQRMALDLLTTHTAAYMLGLDSDTLDARQAATVRAIVAKQIDYLNRFADVIDQQYDAMPDAWRSRAALYAGALKHSWWRGATADFGDLPGYPGDGLTECHGNCLCAWEIDGTRAYWRRHADDSCPGCVRRAQTWNPYILQEA